MNQLPQGASWMGWGKVGPHFRTDRERLMRSKLQDPEPWRGEAYMMCLRSVGSACFGNLPRLVQHQLFTSKEREIGPNWESASIHTLHGPGPETDRNSDWCRTGLQITFRPDLSCPWWSVIAVKPSRKGGGRQGGAAEGLLMKECQNVH